MVEQQDTCDHATPEPACPPMRLAAIAVLAVCAGMATNRWLYATSSNDYVGHVQVDSLTVRAPVDGILQAWEVAEGDTVDPQQLLCRIGGENLNRQLQMQRQETARLAARLKTLQAEVDVKLHEHLRTLESDIYQAELQSADLLQKRYYYELEAMAWRDLRENRKTAALETPNYNLKPKSDASGTDVGDPVINAMLKEEAAINAIEATDAQLEICTMRLDKLQKQKEAMQEKVRQAVGLSEVELQFAQAEADLKELESQLQQQVVHSQAVGTIANLRRRPGEYVKAGEVLAELFLMEESYVVADVPSSHSHNFEVEMPVRCRFPNGEVRTGVVTRVAVSANQNGSIPGLAEPSVPLRIEQTGALWPDMPIGGQITVIR